MLELERRFVFQKYLAPSERDGLASRLGLANAQVVTWFQNRRAKLKRDVEEMRADLASLRLNDCSHPPCLLEMTCACLCNEGLCLSSLVNSRNSVNTQAVTFLRS